MKIDKEIEIFKYVQETDTNRHRPEKAIVYKNTQEGDDN